MHSTVNRVTKVWREETKAEKRRTFQKYPSSTTVSGSNDARGFDLQMEAPVPPRQSDPFDPGGEGIQPALLQQ